MNKNCLEGMACPSCKSEGPFCIEALTMVKMYDSGSEETGGFTWGDDSHCECCQRNHFAAVEDFRAAEAQP